MFPVSVYADDDVVILSLNELEPGDRIIVSWNNLPVFVYRRTKQEKEWLRERASYIQYDFLRKAYALQRISKYIGNTTANYFFNKNSLDIDRKKLRSTKDDYLVVWGQTPFGSYCVVSLVEIEVGINGFYDACTRMSFDLAGRIIKKQGAEKKINLLIPPHHFTSEGLFLGYDGTETSPLIDFTPVIENATLPLNEKLKLSVEWSNVSLVKKYLQIGADPDFFDENGNAVIHYAGISKNIDIIKLFLKHGANINALSSRGTTILHYAAAIGHFEIVSFLINNGAEVMQDCEIICGLSPLGGLSEYSFSSEGVLDVAKLLIENGADPFLKEEGMSPYERATKANNSELMRLFLNANKNE